MKIDALYKHFLITPVHSIPVVDEKEKLFGFLSKSKLLLEMTDLSSAENDFPQIPNSLIEKNLDESILEYFNKNKKIPVINLVGQKLVDWDRTKLIQEFAVRLNDSHAESTSIKEKNQTKQENLQLDKSVKSSNWFGDLILQYLPEPMLATDLEGNTLFFNEYFEIKILKKKHFKNSIKFTEKYLKKINEELLAESIKSNDLIFPDAPLELEISEIDLKVRLILLKVEKKVVAYLYQFFPLSKNLKKDSDAEYLNFLFQKIQSGIPLNKLISTLEKDLILHVFQEKKNNASEVSKFLQIPRTTLLSKIEKRKKDKTILKKRKEIPKKNKSKLSKKFK